MLSTARSGATLVGAGPVEIGEVSTAGTGLRISGAKLMAGSGPVRDSIFVVPRNCGGEAEELVRVLLTTKSSSAEANDDVPGTNPGEKLLTGDEEAWDAVLTALVEEGECVERGAAVSSISIGSGAEKVKLAGGCGKSGFEPGGGARPEVSIGGAVSIVWGGPWIAAGVSMSAVNIWGMSGTDPSCTIVAVKGII